MTNEKISALRAIGVYLPIGVGTDCKYETKNLAIALIGC